MTLLVFFLAVFFRGALLLVAFFFVGFFFDLPFDLEALFFFVATFFLVPLFFFLAGFFLVVAFFLVIPLFFLRTCPRLFLEAFLFFRADSCRETIFATVNLDWLDQIIVKSSF